MYTLSYTGVFRRVLSKASKTRRRKRETKNVCEMKKNGWTHDKSNGKYNESLFLPPPFSSMRKLFYFRMLFVATNFSFSHSIVVVTGCLCYRYATDMCFYFFFLAFYIDFPLAWYVCFGGVYDLHTHTHISHSAPYLSSPKFLHSSATFPCERLIWINAHAAFTVGVWVLGNVCVQS